MAYESSTQIGSGTISFTRGILDPSKRGTTTGGEGFRRGTNVVVINPEDMVSAEAFATSGFTVTRAGGIVQIWGPGITDSNTTLTPLVRQRKLILQNIGPNNLYIGPTEPATAGSGMIVPTSSTSVGFTDTFEMEIMGGVAVYARSDGISQVFLLAY